VKEKFARVLRFVSCVKTVKQDSYLTDQQLL